MAVADAGMGFASGANQALVDRARRLAGLKGHVAGLPAEQPGGSDGRAGCQSMSTS
jgi:hypothetical protein